jgi:putative hydrolase of the HAD superfamily
MTRKSWFVMRFDISRTVVVFDLDDTLYQEADYVYSGVQCVCDQIDTLYGKSLYPEVRDALRQNPRVDWLAMLCECVGLPPAAKESLLWLYRLHEPDIKLSVSCETALEKIADAASAIAVLTDGRSITQRLKLKSLGLSALPVYISEEYGSSKPAPDRFRAIESDFPADQYVYVADNPVKDFLGCNSLGWIGIGMRGDSQNIHSQSLQDHPKTSLPAYWVNDCEELCRLLLKE